MTYLQIVNSVLRRLRIDEAATLADNAYVTLISDLVNETKREVEDAFDWLSLEASVTISAGVGVDSYTLTDFGRRGKVRKVHNTTNKGEINSIDFHRFTRYLDFTDTPDSQPAWWRINGLTGDDPIIQFFPSPDAAYTIKVYGIAPQSDLVAESDVITVPHYPVVLGTYALAIAERGDDRGDPISMAQMAYQSALSDAIAIDNGNRNRGQSTDWILT
jgi:hypothetical protein